MSDTQSKDTPDRSSRVAGTHLSRRDMMKASVVAGGLVWTAPVLLSGKAFAQSCCTSGTEVTVTISPTGEVSCGAAPACVNFATFSCTTDVLDCIPLLVSIQVDITGVVVITPSAGVTVIGVAVTTTGGTAGDCFSTGECPTTEVAGPIVVALDGSVTVATVGLLHGDLEQITLSLCLPGTATALC